jgi:hypothetical protein
VRNAEVIKVHLYGGGRIVAQVGIHVANFCYVNLGIEALVWAIGPQLFGRRAHGHKAALAQVKYKVFVKER